MTTNYSWWRGMRMFPMMCVAMMIVMVIACLLFFGQGRFRPPWAYHIESNTSATALEILDKRYAKGDIGKEEFEQIKQGLMTDGRTTGEHRQ